MYYLHILHQPAVQNFVPDGLSRNPIDDVRDKTHQHEQQQAHANLHGVPCIGENIHFCPNVWNRHRKSPILRQTQVGYDLWLNKLASRKI